MVGAVPRTAHPRYHFKRTNSPVIMPTIGGIPQYLQQNPLTGLFT